MTEAVIRCAGLAPARMYAARTVPKNVAIIHGFEEFILD